MGAKLGERMPHARGSFREVRAHRRREFRIARCDRVHDQAMLAERRPMRGADRARRAGGGDRALRLRGSPKALKMAACSASSRSEKRLKSRSRSAARWSARLTFSRVIGPTSAKSGGGSGTFDLQDAADEQVLTDIAATNGRDVRAMLRIDVDEHIIIGQPRDRARDGPARDAKRSRHIRQIERCAGRQGQLADSLAQSPVGAPSLGQRPAGAEGATGSVQDCYSTPLPLCAELIGYAALARPNCLRARVFSARKDRRDLQGRRRRNSPCASKARHGRRIPAASTRAATACARGLRSDRLGRAEPLLVMRYRPKRIKRGAWGATSASINASN